VVDALSHNFRRGIPTNFGQHRPPSTVLGVVDLAFPEQLIEIAAIAMVSEQP
jgi:enamine deaminase RidA (YjgF/YER057c/UK114 family)